MHPYKVEYIARTDTGIEAKIWTRLDVWDCQRAAHDAFMDAMHEAVMLQSKSWSHAWIYCGRVPVELMWFKSYPYSEWRKKQPHDWKPKPYA